MALLRSVCLWLGLLCACTPALDWRVVKPAGLGLEATFPCRPANLTREVTLANHRVEMAIHACAAGGDTFAVGAVTLTDVREVDAALLSLREAAARNLGSEPGAALQPMAVPGMTPQARAGRSTLTGRRPDGSLVVEHLVLFARGARVYQAMVVGDRPQAEAVAEFFAGLKLIS